MTKRDEKETLLNAESAQLSCGLLFQTASHILDVQILDRAH